ncbi:MAG: hypothetical protein ABSF64_31375 [Bryobacteraceae bacterium]|jgi:hypothetical protein
MKLLLCLYLLCSACLWADQDTDRVAIENVIGALNEPRGDARAKPLSDLFTSDADPAELDRLSDMERRMREVSSGPWSEVTAPRIVARSVRFVTPDVALVDAAISQIGSLSASHKPVLLVMKKQGTDWRIACLRLGYR